MDFSELKGTCVMSRNGANCEDWVESTENEPWEEEINPLGLLDLVYVEDEEGTNDVHLIDSESTSSVSTKTNMEEQKSTSDNLVDSDEGDELEPVAAVDVLPGREEDFLPEGMTQEFVEPSRNTWSTCWVSNADLTDHQLNWQESQLVDSKSILQRVLEVPREMWPLQIQPLSSYSTNHLTKREITQEINISQNHLSQPIQPRTVPNEDRRQYYQQYRQKYPELIRIRNREYARRYRQANAERVRERQRDYVRRYRERKRIKKEQADLLE